MNKYDLRDKPNSNKTIKDLERLKKSSRYTDKQKAQFQEWIDAKTKENDELIAKEDGVAIFLDDRNKFFYLAKVQLYREGHASFQKAKGNNGRVECGYGNCDEDKHLVLIMLTMYKVMRQYFIAKANLGLGEGADVVDVMNEYERRETPHIDIMDTEDIVPLDEELRKEEKAHAGIID